MVRGEKALGEVRQFVTNMEQRPLKPQRASAFLEQFRNLVRRVPGLKWQDILDNEGLRKALQPWVLHINPKLASRARDTLQMVEAWAQQQAAPLVLQASFGAQRCSGQEGYPEMVLHKSVIVALRQLFQDNDGAGVETMALLYGAQLAGSTQLVVTDILQVEHIADVTSCQVTAQGYEQWVEANSQLEPKTLLGWSHSHHKLSLVPQGRVPSQTDVDTQYNLQKNYAQAKLMLILNEEGWTAWTLPHGTMELLRQHNGTCTGPSFTKLPEDPCVRGIKF